MTAVAEEKEDTRRRADGNIAYFADGGPLIRALSNGLLFSGKDETLPMLCVIRFEFDGSKLTAVATDRYRLCLEDVELDPKINHDGQPPFAFHLRARDAKSALAAIKANRRDQILLHLDRSDALHPAVEFRFYSQTARYEIDDDHTFPPYRTLIPNPDELVAADRMKFSVPFLGDLAKVQTADKSQFRAVEIKLYGTGKITRIDYRNGPMLLLMSQKPQG